MSGHAQQIVEALLGEDQERYRIRPATTGIGWYSVQKQSGEGEWEHAGTFRGRSAASDEVERLSRGKPKEKPEEK